MRKHRLATLVTALFALFATPALADRVLIKLGTSAPDGSPWHTQLKKASQAWKEISGDTVSLKIFAGGSMGDEGDMVQKMRIGQLHSAALSTIGLHMITPEPQALDLPLMVNDYQERDYLLSKMAPQLEKALADKGYIVLTWSEIGFTYFFSTKPMPDLNAMRKAKLFTWSGDPASKDAWQAGGFSPVVLSAVDMVSSLQTGMIDTIVYPPTVVNSIHADDKAKYMMDLKWSTLTGATVVKKDQWEKIPADIREKLKQVFVQGGAEMTATARKFEDDSLKTMKAKGLQVVKVTDAQTWPAAVKAVFDAVRGKVVPASTFDEVLRIVKEYRAGKKAAN